ncbi:HD domain-containing protein [Membranihabitans marinus]|uniref:HD domain-containing protein n=1 Tax=Membranihabitans marinus TaxID=1227546 RepID=UPI001F1FD7F4|nr:HD domain-containing protein [Membranihabitans marinus]
MEVENILDHTVSYVKSELAEAESGHDFWHVERVWKLSSYIADREQYQNIAVDLGALLHDIADAKFHNGNEDIAIEKTSTFLSSIDVAPSVREEVLYIIKNISYRSSLERDIDKSMALQIVQDADRLDAIGAIGIARAFNYGGYRNRPLYDPRIPIVRHQSKEEYRGSTAPTIHHFYDKLLRLKDQMNTETGRLLAEERHVFLEQYLDQFFREWNVEGL